jgi:hypothetical protein
MSILHSLILVRHLCLSAGLSHWQSNRLPVLLVLRLLVLVALGLLAVLVVVVLVVLDLLAVL